MAKQDIIKWEILEDGTVSVTTDGVSGTNHFSADELLDQLGEALGGKVTRVKRSKFAVGVSLYEHAAMKAHAADGHSH
jgi:hypothetical protein